MVRDGAKKRKSAQHQPSSVDDGSGKPPLKSLKQDLRKFKEDWKQDPKLSCFESHGKKAFCTICSKVIEGSVSHLYRHVESTYHKTRASVVSVSADIRKEVGKSGMKQKSEKGRLLWLKFICDHNLPFSLMDHLTQTAAKVYTDSKIAPSIQSGRTVSKGLIVNCIGKESLNIIVEKLKTQKFSLLADETTDVSTTKQLALVVRFLDDKTESVQDNFLQLIDMPIATADALFDSINMFFQKYSIPFVNMIGFAADNAAVMMGNQNGLKSKLEQVSPNLFVIGCVCHSLHLCSSAACLKLPKTVEDLCRDIYNYLCHSPKRLNEYKDFQQFTNIEPHKLLHPSQTRWLSLQCVIDRILEQWNALVLYFQSAALEDHLESAQTILSALKNPIYKMYFYFLGYILPYVTKMNREFQSEGLQIHHAYEKICALYKSILSNYLKAELLNTQDIFSLNIKDPSNFKRVEDINWGSKVQQMMQEELNVEASLVSGFQVKCLNFYIELVTQIKKRFIGMNKILPHLVALDPDIATSENKSNLFELLSLFPNLVSEPLKDAVNDEWRNLSFYIKRSEIPSDPVKFWYKVRNIKYADKSSVFPNLSEFMLSLSVLPHSSAAVERVFSQVKLIKTDIRNRLSTESVNGILLTKMNGTGKPCHEWEPTKEMLQTASKFKTEKEED